MKKSVLVAAAVIAVAAITGGVLLAANPSWSPLSGVRDRIDGTYSQRQADVKQAEVVRHDALSLIPADAFIVSHASMSTMSGDWWKTYSALMPKNVSLPSSLADLGVAAITYAVSPNNSSEYAAFNPTGTEIVLAVDPKADPEAVVAAINETAGPGALFVTTSTVADATYVIVSDVPSWEQVDALARGTSKIDTFSTREQASSLKVNSEEPFMFVDMSAYLGLMTSYVKDNPDAAKFVATLLDSGFGMTGDTTWLGTTTDGGLHWEGAFLTGGVSNDKINIDAYQKAISDQIQFIPSEGSATAAPDGSTSGGVLQYGYVAQGLSTTADAVSISVGGKSTGAVVNPHDMGAKPVVAEATGSDIVVVFSPQMFQAAFQGVIDPYSIHTVTVTVKGDSDKVLIDFELYKEADYNGTDSNAGPTVAPSPSATP